ncbi:hypothetical protein M501DRAFT_1004996 [Patellaria atrata CBS 101060]|uniref:Uncharacterized protein n=1 Tax=Patellaria atrata CBS 101060 TaxID=1346257 RepID=A0A9P4VS36_9PEZI|nr:hypothetical protein M501DRAFT_1004996 [Patellaria atrata CBS 101060]
MHGLSITVLRPRGLGGMGKTQIVIEYTYRYKSAYEHIFFLRAETGQDLAEMYKDMEGKGYSNMHAGDKIGYGAMIKIHEHTYIRGKSFDAATAHFGNVYHEAQ